LRHGGTVTEITISAREEADSLIIRYTDNGSGIEDSIKEKIFKRGFGKHTGYGLFLIREILSITKISIQEVGKYGSGAIFEMHVPSPYYKRDESSPAFS
jgi:signal transduction histidine kinase